MTTMLDGIGSFWSVTLQNGDVVLIRITDQGPSGVKGYIQKRIAVSDRSPEEERWKEERVSGTVYGQEHVGVRKDIRVLADYTADGEEIVINKDKIEFACGPRINDAEVCSMPLLSTHICLEKLNRIEKKFGWQVEKS